MMEEENLIPSSSTLILGLFTDFENVHATSLPQAFGDQIYVQVFDSFKQLGDIRLIHFPMGLYLV